MKVSDRMKKQNRFISALTIIILIFSFCSGITVADGSLEIPEGVADFDTYDTMQGVAWDSAVEGLPIGSAYHAYWDGQAYTFMVGVDVFATFEAAYAASKAAVPTIFALPGKHESITLTGPVHLYGYYYQVDPNVRHEDETICPSLNQSREEDMESSIGNISVAAGVTGEIEICGIELRGVFEDYERKISGVPTEITLENIIVRQESGIASGSWAFNLLNQNAVDTTTASAVNQDSFTLLNCRIEHLVTNRIFSNMIPTRFTVDGLVTAAGCTAFFGYAQWRRYRENAVFTMQNCYFDQFASREGHINYFFYMEGLNKFNGDCTITIADNVFTGDADYMVGLYVKKGYDITLSGNTFIAETSAGREPFYWNIGYDNNLYSDYEANANVSSVDLSDRVTITKNRFVGYNSFQNVVNSKTVFDLSDNFFTTDLEHYRTVIGTAPIKGDGVTSRTFWADFDCQVPGSTVPELTFGGAFSGSGTTYTLYTATKKVDLCASGLTYPAGTKMALSNGSPLTAVSCSEGSNSIKLTVYSYDNTATRQYTLQIYCKTGQSEAMDRLHIARIRLLSGCYTDQSLVGYSDCIDALWAAVQSGTGTTQALAALDEAEAALVYKSGAQADFKYYSYFSDLKRFYIADTAGWKTLIEQVHANNDLYGVIISLTADLDFGGATIRPVGGCYETDTPTDNAIFCGTLNGNNHTIENFVINEPESYGVGLFGRTLGGTIRDLQVGSGTVTGYDKVGGIAGFADSSALINCSNKADVVGVSGVNGIGGITSQARMSWNPNTGRSLAAEIRSCINYGSVTSTKGRACGIIAWGQSSAVQKYCVNYGALNGTSNDPFGMYSVTDLSRLVVNCYYSGAAGTSGTDLAGQNLKEVAHICSLNLLDDKLVISGSGEKVYRALLQWSEGYARFYGFYGEQIAFDIPGYAVTTVVYRGSERPLSGLYITNDCTMTGTPLAYHYKIQYVINGGSFRETPIYSYCVDETVTLPGGSMIEKDGYVFAGWYTSSNFSGERVLSIPEGAMKDYVFYAKYAAIDRYISTADQLVTLARDVNNGNSLANKAVVITADIDLSGISFPGIGNSTSRPFAGVLAGGGHSITGLSVSATSAGLIGALAETGIVSELEVQGNVSGKIAGGIVGNNQGGLIENCSFNGNVSSSATEIRVVSQNLRVNSSKNVISIEERHEGLRNIIKSQNPDIIGFQEADKTWESYLKSDYSEYNYVWYWRGIGNQSKENEATPIFYKKDKFNLLDQGRFWLSDTPDQPSYCFNEDMNRIVIWVKLQVKETGEIFYYFNTHFSLDNTSRFQSEQVLRERVLSKVGDQTPFYITADFNMQSSENTYQNMTTWCTDMALAAEVDETNNSGTFAPSFQPTPANMRIDMGFYNEDAGTVPYYKVILDTITVNGKEYAPSDHFGVFFRTRLQSASGGICGNNMGEIWACAASNGGTAGVYGGVIAGENRGMIHSYNVSGGAGVGKEYGSETSNIYTASSVEEGVVLLNRQAGRMLWGVKDGAITFLPEGETIYYAQFLNLNGSVFRRGYYTEAEINAFDPGFTTDTTTFDSWKWSISGDTVTLTPSMRVVAYRVKFLNRQGAVVEEQIVQRGGSATLPELSDEDGWVFLGWSSDLSVVLKDQTVQSLWAEQGSFTLTLQIQGKGTLLMNGSPVTNGSEVTASAGTSFRFTADSGEILCWQDESGTILSESDVYSFALTKNTVLTAVFKTIGTVETVPEPPEDPAYQQPEDDAMIALSDELVLTRNVQGDYAVLGSGIIYTDSAARMLVLEAADGEIVFTAAATSLSRRGSTAFDVDAGYVRGYLVLLNERTGETVIQYTDVLVR